MTPEELDLFRHNVKEEILHQKTSVKKIASLINMSYPTLANKLNGYNIISESEVMLIMKALDITKEEAFKVKENDLTLDLKLKRQTVKLNLLDILVDLSEQKGLNTDRLEAMTKLVSIINDL